LTRFGRLQGDKLGVELLSFLGIVGESLSIQCWCGSNDRYSKDSEKKERRKMHLKSNPINDCVRTGVDKIELMEVVQDTGKRAPALRI
jgi:hypothetical protein